jgi:uracil-DNA glycosylase family protein
LEIVKEEKPATLNSTDELPVFSDLKEAEVAAKNCRRCPLWERATQTVFGSGATQARLLLVGEQPGDVEDRTGLPFVGPAGRLLDRALQAAQISRDLCYVTNAVKHFKWEPLGQRRLHKKPTSRELQACRPWLQVEIELVQPEVVVGLGATAATTIFGCPVRIADVRGKTCLITTHPSSVLRAPDPDARQAEFDRLVQELTLLKEFAG